jgi:hypothetical protein
MRATAKKRLEAIRMRLQYGVAKPQNTAAVLEAAQYFGVDITDERGRDLLLAALAEFIFGKGNVGRPKGRGGWTDTELSKLYDAISGIIYEADVCEDGVYVTQHHVSDAQLAKMIAEKFAADRKNGVRGRFHSVEAIRRHIPKARDWFHLWFDEFEPPDDWEAPKPDYDDQDD